jgi:hypothetical protein
MSSTKPDKKITEQSELIATRIPPGDRWTLKNDSRKVIHNSLTEALEAFYIETRFKGDYRLAPVDSKLYAIKLLEEEIVQEPPKTFNIYGDPV